jgi:hypothetical protein
MDLVMDVGRSELTSLYCELVLNLPMLKSTMVKAELRSELTSLYFKLILNLIMLQGTMVELVTGELRSELASLYC